MKEELYDGLRLYSRVPQCEIGKIDLSTICFSCPSSMSHPRHPVGEFTETRVGAVLCRHSEKSRFRLLPWRCFLLGSGSLGSAVGGDGAVGAVVPRWPALMSERVASDSAGSTTSDLSRPSGERAGGIAMWRARPQWTKSQAINGKETNAPKVQRPKVECSYGLRSYSPKVLRVYEIKAPAHFLLTPWLQKC